MTRWIVLLLLIATCLWAFAAQKPKVAESKLELLVFKGCPNSPRMQANLESALLRLKQKLPIKVVDLEKLRKGDRRTGYGAPTLLVNGKDPFGSVTPAPTSSLSCRIYPGGGVPSVAQMERVLRKLLKANVGRVVRQ